MPCRWWDSYSRETLHVSEWFFWPTSTRLPCSVCRSECIMHRSIEFEAFAEAAQNSSCCDSRFRVFNDRFAVGNLFLAVHEVWCFCCLAISECCASPSQYWTEQVALRAEELANCYPSPIKGHITLLCWLLLKDLSTVLPHDVSLTLCTPFAASKSALTLCTSFAASETAGANACGTTSRIRASTKHRST